MATRLIQTIAFLNVPAAGVAVLPHTLNIAGAPIAPDLVLMDTAGFSAVVTSATVTVTNNNDAIASVNVWLQREHTTPRELGAVPLAPAPFVAASGGNAGSAGAFQTQWIYRPGSGATGPVVYADFNDLFTALDAVRTANGGLGSYQITMDETVLNPVVLPNAAFNMAGVSWVGQTNFSQSTVELSDGSSIINLVEIRNCAITRSAFVGAAPLAVDASSPPLVLTNTTLTSGVLGVTGNVFLVLGDGANITGSVPGTASVLVDPGVSMTAVMQGAGSQCNLEAFSGDATTSISFTIQNPTSTVQPQTLVLSNMLVDQLSPIWAGSGNPNGPAGPGLPIPVFPSVLGAKYIDAVTGTEYTCTNTLVPTWV